LLRRGSGKIGLSCFGSTSEKIGLGRFDPGKIGRSCFGSTSEKIGLGRFDPGKIGLGCFGSASKRIGLNNPGKICLNGLVASCPA
jgi:hypothetical protein